MSADPVPVAWLQAGDVVLRTISGEQDAWTVRAITDDGDDRLLRLVPAVGSRADAPADGDPTLLYLAGTPGLAEAAIDEIVGIARGWRIAGGALPAPPPDRAIEVTLRRADKVTRLRASTWAAA